MKRFDMHCNACDSTAVTQDAWAVWDENKQDWVLVDYYDTYYCIDCEQVTDIYEEEIKE